MVWSKNAIDLIGSWRINITVEFNALKCIDMVSHSVEMIRCIHDNWGKFIGEAFQTMLQRNGIKDSPTTSCNPQTNVVCEELHQMVANILRTTINNKTNNYQQVVRVVDDTLITAMHTTQCAVS
eukprot:11842311-Ditylum_brightwellii.AAC.1